MASFDPNRETATDAAREPAAKAGAKQSGAELPLLARFLGHRLTLPLAALAVVVLLAGAFIVAMTGNDEEPAASCPGGAQLDATIAAVRDLPRLPEADDCSRFSARTLADAAVPAALLGGVDTPDLWVTANAVALADARAVVGRDLPAEQVGQTRYLLVGNAPLTSPANWSVAVTVPAFRANPGAPDAVAALLAADKSGTPPPAPPVLATDLSDPAGPLTSLLPGQTTISTEWEYSAAKRTHPEINAIVPKTGTLSVPVQLVTTAIGDRAVAIKDSAAAYLEALRAEDPNAEGSWQRGDFANFPDLGSPPTTEPGTTPSTGPATPTGPSTTLILVDTSTSMGGSVPGPTAATETRIGWASEAVKAAVATAPNGAAVGLWRFSIGQPDYQQRVTARPLDAIVAISGNPQRVALTDEANLLTGSVGGGTGLYDTLASAVAALRSGGSAVDGTDPAAPKRIVLVTDGGNDDTNSIALADLLGQLGTDIRVDIVGIGPDVDRANLEQITAAAGGSFTDAATEPALAAALTATLAPY